MHPSIVNGRHIFMNSLVRLPTPITYVRTSSTEISAARARMSAQETTPGQASSSAAFTLSTTGNPRAELLFAGANFSVELATPGKASNSTEPSQP